MAHILIVCTANICRSPVVAAMLRERLRQAGHDDWHVASGGTLAMPGLGASTYGVEVLAERGLEIAEHRSRRVESEDVERADLVLCMESGHAEALKIENPEHAERIFLITEMIGRHEDVADPYGGPREWYVEMADDMAGLIGRALPRIVELARAHAATRARRAASG